MPNLKPMTLDDIRAIDDCYERLLALNRWQRHNKERWKQVRKEMHNFSNMTGRIKRRHRKKEGDTR